MKDFFGFVGRLFGAIGILFVSMSTAVAVARASTFSIRPPTRLRPRHLHTSTPTPTPKPTATPTPKPAPTGTPSATSTPTPIPTAAPSTTPVSTPTPSNVGSEVTIYVPGNGQTVSGKTLAVGVTLGPDVYWDQLKVDGSNVASGSSNFIWDSTTVTNGGHTLTVRVFQQGGTVPIGTASVSVVVNNLAASPTPAASSTPVSSTPSPTPDPTSTPAPPTPTPSAAPTPTGTAPQHFDTMPAAATLPTGTQCAGMVPVTAETVPGNTPFNQTVPTSAQLSSYAIGGYTFDYRDSYAQYQRVDGQYTGSTDMMMRWAACKYGIDEDIVRAQAWVESGWRQSGAGDKRTTYAQCVQGNFTALWNTTISMPNGSTVSCPSCCYTSWSAWQTKVFYEWMTWPEIMQSTAFGADYRYADQRACMDGAYTSYFAGRNVTYASDIAAYKAGGDVSRVLWGCIGMHFSGNWYDSGAQTYIGQVQNALVVKPWPH